MAPVKAATAADISIYGYWADPHLNSQVSSVNFFTANFGGQVFCTFALLQRWHQQMAMAHVVEQ